MNIVERIEHALRAALRVQSFRIEDDSALHAGHEGAKGGGGHYRLQIVSPDFAGKPRVMRHRLVYDALHPLMQREIHALAIDARAPNESGPPPNTDA
ncbi:MAG TPA: BolA family protein [Burkholderiaceae bacterium]|nr:BolA family protein [Burkholderiaceae bacterium]